MESCFIISNEFNEEGENDDKDFESPDKISLAILL